MASTVKLVLKVTAIRTYRMSKTVYELIIIDEEKSRDILLDPVDVIKISIRIKDHIKHTETYGYYPSLEPGFTEIIWTDYVTVEQAFSDIREAIQADFGVSLQKVKSSLGSYPYKIGDYETYLEKFGGEVSYEI